MAKVMKIMKKILFIAAAMVAALTSCVKEADVEIPQEEAKVWVEFTAGVQTKAVLDGKSVTWEATDVVSINGVEFTTTEEDITAEGAAAKFRAEVGASFLEAESFTAVYPADAASWAESSLTGVVVPAEQNGTAKVVAVATVEDVTQTLNFMHVASFFKFQVPAAATEVTISADEALVGTVNNVTFTTVDEVTTLAYEVLSGENTITVSSGFVPETDYYAAVLPGTKTNLTVSIDGKVSKTWANPVNVKQGMIANMKVLPAPEKDTRVVSFADENVEVTLGTTGHKVQTLTGVEESEVVTYEVEGEAATVDAEGNITLLAAGTVTITATVAENDTYKSASASYTLTVNKAERIVSFSTTTATIGDPNNFIKPTLSCEPSSDNVTYISSDVNIAKVDNNGNITRVKEGTVTITATVAETDTHNAGSASYTLTVLKESAWRVTGLTSWSYDSAIKMYEENNMAVAKNVNINGTFKFNNGKDWVGLGEVGSKKVYAHIYDGNNMTIAAGNYDIYISKNMTGSSGFMFFVPAGTDISEDNVLNYSYGLIGNGNWDTDFKKLTFDPRGYFVATDVKISGEFKIRQDNAWNHSWGTGSNVTSSGATIYYNGGNSTANGTYDIYTDFCKIWLMSSGKTPTL